MKATQSKEDLKSPVQKAAKTSESGHSAFDAKAGGNTMAPPAFQLKSSQAIQKADAPADEKWTKVKEILEKTPTGKEALKRMTDYSITVEFVAGGGSYYDGSASKMVIDANHSPERASLSFVHEMNHAYYDKEGKTADASTESREDYVKKMVDEEAEGVVKSIEAKIELEGTDVSTTGLSYPLETEYRTAYKKCYDDAIAAKKPEDEAKAMARIAGMARVKKGFMDGEVVTSTDGKSYPTFYGDYWDSVHP
jgi:hypothetical protein